MAGMTCWRSGQRKRGLGLAGVAGSLGIEESLIGKPCQVLLESYLPVLYHLGIDSQTLRQYRLVPLPGTPHQGFQVLDFLGFVLWCRFVSHCVSFSRNPRACDNRSSGGWPAPAGPTGGPVPAGPERHSPSGPSPLGAVSGPDGVPPTVRH